MITDTSEDFYLYMKYTSNQNEPKKKRPKRAEWKSCSKKIGETNPFKFSEKAFDKG